MRALTAIFILSACSRLHAQSDIKTIKNILDCTFTIGPAKCLNALTAWRAERALNSSIKSNLTSDLEQFPWNKYKNATEEELYSEVCDDTEQLLRKKPLTLTLIPGYRVELLSKGNGKLNVDVYKHEETQSGRSSMKKAKKKLYSILPLLVLPGLMMSAILPFILPALKMMVLGAGMLNNMALSGAVFTLLRNNAFNDNYEHKIIYVNEGYKNEKHAHLHSHFEEHENLEQVEHGLEDYHYAESNPNVALDIPEIETIEELPMDNGWVNQFYGKEQNMQIVNNGNQIKRRDKTKLSS